MNSRRVSIVTTKGNVYKHGTGDEKQEVQTTPRSKLLVNNNFLCYTWTGRQCEVCKRKSKLLSWPQFPSVFIASSLPFTNCYFYILVIPSLLCAYELITIRETTDTLTSFNGCFYLIEIVQKYRWNNWNTDKKGNNNQLTAVSKNVKVGGSKTWQTVISLHITKTGGNYIEGEWEKKTVHRWQESPTKKNKQTTICSRVDEHCYLNFLLAIINLTISIMWKWMKL